MKKLRFCCWQLSRCSPLGVKIFPTEQAAQSVEEALAQALADAKSGVAVTISYTWDRFNIVKLVVPSVMDFHMTTSVLTMDYDDRTSPFYGLVGGVESFAQGSLFSKNNVMKMVDSKEGVKNTYQYTYEYNAIGFPTKAVQTTSCVYSGVTHDYQRVTEYEYDDLAGRRRRLPEEAMVMLTPPISLLYFSRHHSLPHSLAPPVGRFAWTQPPDCFPARPRPPSPLASAPSPLGCGFFFAPAY